MGLIRNTAAALLGIAMMPALAQAETKWDLPNSLSPNNFLTGVTEEFAADVKESTGGKLVITVHPGGSLFRQNQIKRAVQTGQVQMGDILLSSYSNEDPIFGVDSLPFLTSSYKDAWKLYQASKPALQKRMAEAGAMVVYAGPLPPQALYAKDPITKAADAKGLKWRAYSPLTSRLAELLGAQPVTIMSSELSQAMATGAVHAFITSSGTGYDTKVFEHFKYVYDTEAWVPKNLMLMNKAAFDALDKPTQDALLAAADRAEKKAWKISEEKHAWYIKELAANGMTVAPPSPQLKGELVAIGKQMTEEWLKTAGPDGKAILDAYAKQ
ncbi:TRAP transporter substrate-binding protein [Oceanibaculum pacificum]|nr:TRAP transporter substrate-binding protein [Oceanibaculum pacificum]